MKKIFFLLTILLISSCEDYLQEDNPNAPDFDVVFQSLDDTDKSLIAVYNSMYNPDILNLEYESLRSDEAITQTRAQPGTISGNPGLLAWLTHEVDATNPNLSSKWAALYRGIFFANQTIEGLNTIKDNVNGETETKEWTSQMAQARFFRGLYHYYLHSVFNFGEIIIRDKYTRNIKDANKSLSSSEEVQEFFRKDLQYAYDNLDISAVQTGRVSKGTAAMILANSYLYEGTIDLYTGRDEAITKAKDLYKEIIDDFGYQLEDPEILFTSEGSFSKESIFEIAFSNTINAELDQFDELSLHNRLAWQYAISFFGGNQRVLPAAWLIHSYANEEMDQTFNKNFINGDISGQERSVSLRASAMVVLVNDLETPLYGKVNTYQFGFYNAGGNFASPFGGGNNLPLSMFRKYINHDTVENERTNSADNALKSGKNVIINRLSEAHLNLAECYLKLGEPFDLALEQINIVRRRWGLKQLGLGNTDQFDNIDYSNPNDVMDHLAFIEKPMELSVEGHSTRFIDLRRWGVFEDRLEDLANKEYEACWFPAAPIESRISEAAAGGPWIDYTFNAQVIIDKNYKGQTVETWNRNRDGGARPQDKITTTTFVEFQANFASFNDQGTNPNDNDLWLPIPADEEINNNNL